MSNYKYPALVTVRARVLFSQVESILRKIEVTPDPLQTDLYAALDRVVDSAAGMLERNSTQRPPPNPRSAASPFPHRKRAGW